MPATQRFFKKDTERHWHAFRDDAPDALCGVVRIAYNRDDVADALPAEAKLHGKCAEALKKAG